MRRALSAAAAVAVFLKGGCSLLGSTYSYRYRMTVEVDTLDGVKTGSGVEEQIVGSSNIDMGDLSGKRGMRTRGEAVAVDLPGGQTLFVLVPGSEAAQAALDPRWQNDWVESAQRITRGQTPRGPMPIAPASSSFSDAQASYGPALIRVQKLDDPATVEWVDPRNLEAKFGRGVHLRSVTVEVTDDPITRGIEGRLPWLKNYLNRPLSDTTVSNSYGQLIPNLRAGSFSTELRR